MFPKTFHCPNCNAPLRYRQSEEPTVECSYCHSAVIVPEGWRTPPPRPARPAAPPSPPPQPFRPQYPHLPSAQSGRDKTNAEIEQLLKSGKRPQALRLYRESYDRSLTEAENVIAELEKGQPFDKAQITGRARIVAQQKARQLEEKRQAAGSTRNWLAWLLLLLFLLFLFYALYRF